MEILLGENIRHCIDWLENTYNFRGKLYKFHSLYLGNYKEYSDVTPNNYYHNLANRGAATGLYWVILEKVIEEELNT